MKQVWAWLINQDGQLSIIADQKNSTEISNETLNSIIQKSQIVGRFIAKHVYFEMLFYNFVDVIKAIEEFEHNEKNFQFEHEFIPYSTNINRLLINALGSIFTYVNHYENGIPDTNISNDIKRLSSQFFDEFPLYRFLYKLRNYVVHIDMPVTQLSSGIDTPYKEFYIDKNHLLERFDWGAKVRSDLENFPDEISVKKLASEAIKLFVKFHKQMMMEQINEILEIQQYFDGFGRIIENHIQYPLILKVNDENAESVQIEDLFTDNVVLIEEAMRVIGIDAHSGRKTENADGTIRV